MKKDQEMLFEQHVTMLEHLLRRISTIIKRRGRNILTEFSITPPQFNALLCLKKYGTLTIGELGEKMYLACSTATDLIDRMERNNLVTRVRDTKDRRVVRIKLLEQGYKMYDEVMAARISYLSSMLEQVAVNDRETMIQSMQLLYNIMTEQEN